MKKVYILPNLFTTASLFYGILAIIKVFHGDYDTACWYIIISGMFDAMDGKVARLTKTVSEFGINYDSLSDLVVFGVAPACLIYSKFAVSKAIVGFPSVTLTGIVALYIICAAMRLARFNVQQNNVEKKAFTGLPTPAAAGTIVTFNLAFGDITNPGLLKFIPIMMIVLSYLMVSKVPYPSSKGLELEKRKQFDYLVTIIIILCGIYAFREYIHYILFAICFIYDFTPLKVLFTKKHKVELPTEASHNRPIK